MNPIEFEAKVKSIKKRFLKMYFENNAGHVGASLSCIEILVFIRMVLMKANDRFILSKGHAAAALYSCLAEQGFLSQEDIQTYYNEGTYLSAHPPVNKIKEIFFATGSLGHGLGLCAGFGLASKILKKKKSYIVLLAMVN